MIIKKKVMFLHVYVYNIFKFWTILEFTIEVLFDCKDLTIRISIFYYFISDSILSHYMLFK